MILITAFSKFSIEILKIEIKIEILHDRIVDWILGGKTIAVRGTP